VKNWFPSLCFFRCNLLPLYALAFLNHPALATLFTEDDAELLAYVTEVSEREEERARAFSDKLHFCFFVYNSPPGVS
jgi:hypothetical protein